MSATHKHAAKAEGVESPESAEHIISPEERLALCEAQRIHCNAMTLSELARQHPAVREMIEENRRLSGESHKKHK